MRDPFEGATVEEVERVGRFGRLLFVDFLDTRQQALRYSEQPRHPLHELAVAQVLELRARQAPDAQELLVECRDAGVAIGHEDAIGGGLQRRPHHRQGFVELAGAPLELLLGGQQFLVGPVAREQDALRVAQGDGAHLLVFVR